MHSILDSTITIHGELLASVFVKSIRDFIYRFREKIRFLFLSKFIEGSRMNLDYLRSKSSLSIAYPLFFPFFMKRFYFATRVKTLMRSNTNHLKSIYIEIDCVNYVKPFLDRILRDFNGIFLINPMDQTMNQRPEWVGNSAKWASPNIENPFDSDGILIPLGIEDLRRGRNGNVWNFKVSKSKKMKILVGPFAPTHEERISLYEFEQTPLVRVLKRRIRPLAYSRIATEFAFVLCPRGNGLDTHRFWETLHRQSIPIVKKSSWARYWEELNLPLLIVDDFEDIYALSEEHLSEIYLRLSERFQASNTLLSNDYWRKTLLL